AAGVDLHDALGPRAEPYVTVTDIDDRADPVGLATLPVAAFAVAQLLRRRGAWWDHEGTGRSRPDPDPPFPVLCQLPDLDSGAREARRRHRHKCLCAGPQYVDPVERADPQVAAAIDEERADPVRGQ